MTAPDDPAAGTEPGSPGATLDFSPAPGAAPARRRITGHARTEALLLARNGEQLLLALVIPLGLLLLGRFTGSRFGVDFDVVAPSVLALAVWSTCFTSLAIATGFERRYGVLERLASTPLTRTGLIVGKACALTLVSVVQLLVLGAAALALGWRPAWQPVPITIAVLAVLLAATAFAGLAMLLAGTLRAEITLALANLVYLVFVVAGAIMIPVSAHPAALQPIVRLLPTAALGEALRNSSAGITDGWPLLVLLVWAVLAVVVGRKVFRWMS